MTSTQGVGTTSTLIAPLIEGELQQGEEPIVPENCVSILCDTEQNFRVLLVDDHAVMREGLSSLLETQPDIEIVGEAYDGEQAIAMARKLRPNVILMDINMPYMNGIEATQIISKKDFDLRIIGLSMYDDRENKSAMLAAGAVACLPKDGSSEAIFAAIRGNGEIKKNGTELKS